MKNERELYSVILEIAEKIKAEKGFKNISPMLIVAACGEFVSRPYNGAVEYIYPERFEEERLRFIYRTINNVGLSWRNLFVRNIRQNPEKFDVTFDFTECNNISRARGKGSVSADLLFLSAFSAISAPDRACPEIYKRNLDVAAIMTVIDECIYDYVIKINRELCAELNKKIDEATALRGWRPAKKFAEPEKLAEQLISYVKTDFSDNVLKLIVPGFFGANDLVVSIHSVDGIYYLSDNGCAIKHLRERVNDDRKAEETVNRCISERFVVNNSVTGVFTDERRFLRYLQNLIFIANADLFYDRIENKLDLEDENYCYNDENFAEQFDCDNVLGILKKCFRFGYDKNEGVFVNFSTGYASFSKNISFLLEVVDESRIRISDSRKGKTEGEIFEAFYWLYNDITPYTDFIRGFADRFGAVLEDKNIYLTDVRKNWLPALLRFINTAVLLSEFGHNIKVLTDED